LDGRDGELGIAGGGPIATSYEPHDCLSRVATYSHDIRRFGWRFIAGLGFYEKFGGAEDAKKMPRKSADFCIQQVRAAQQGYRHLLASMYATTQYHCRVGTP
jgi:hypothetical protein